MTEAAAAPAEETSETTETTETKEATTEVKETEKATEKTTEKATETVVANWRDPIKDESVRKFADNFTTLEECAKSGLGFRQKLSNAISLPGKDASEDDIKAFHNKLGVPESADKYEITKLEGLSEDLNNEALDAELVAVANVLHAAHATPAVATAVFNHFQQVMMDAQEAEDKVFADNVAAGEVALRKEWAGDFDTNKEYANRAVKQFGGEEALTILANATYEGVELANHPAFMKMHASIGRKMGEGGLESIMTDDQRQTSEEKMDELTREAHQAQSDNDSIKADRLFRERDKLAQTLYGSGN